MTRGVLAMLVVLTACQGEEAPPAQAVALHVELADSGPVMQLPTAMRAALTEYAPNFRPWRLQEYDQRVHEKARPPRSLPIFATGSDMNADGAIDLAVYGHDDTNELLFVLMSDGARYRVIELRRVPLPSPAERMPQAHYLEPAEDGRPGFIESIEGVAGVLYYWADGRFQMEPVGG